MRIVLVTDAAVEVGRGPVARLLGVLPELARRSDLSLVLLGRPGPETSSVLATVRVPVRTLSPVMMGWRVCNADVLAREITTWAVERDADLVVLQWELWDLMVALQRDLRPRCVEFATIVHATPLINAPSRPSECYLDDLAARVEAEVDPAVREYLLERGGEVPEIMREMRIISPNPTTTFLLANYFPSVEVFEIDPAYAVPSPDEVRGEPSRDFDCVFMSKLVAEKGVFDVLEIFERVRRVRREARLLMIGSFEDRAEEDRFQSAAERLGVASAIARTGWLGGPAKWRALQRGKVFVYPAAESDTFCLSLLEALACGHAVVAADVPYVQFTYPKGIVRRVAPGDVDGFARAVLDELSREDTCERSTRARVFAARYQSWAAVADAETSTYRSLVRAAAEPESRVAAAVRGWLLRSGVQRGSGAERGAVSAWLSEDSRGQFYYPEATGYYLTWLEALLRVDPAFEPAIRRRAADALGWLERVVERDPRIPTRVPVTGELAGWRSNCFFSFDWAVVLRGLVAAGRLMDCDRVRPTLQRFASAGLEFFNGPAPMLAYVLRNPSGPPPPVRWSTRFGLHHAKACALLRECTLSWAADAIPPPIVDAITPASAALRTLDARPCRDGDAHGLLYGLEGFLLLGRSDRREDWIELVGDQLLAFIESYAPRTGNSSHGGSDLVDERTDVIAQVVRLGASLAHLSKGGRKKWMVELSPLKAELLRRVLPDGGVTFRSGNGSDPVHRNAWCAMFTWQALMWWKQLEVKGDSGELSTEVWV